MDQLVQMLMSKVGLDEAKAGQVVEVVTGHLKNVLPSPLKENVDKLLSGDVTDIAQIAGLGGKSGGLGGILSGLFGGGKK